MTVAVSQQWQAVVKEIVHLRREGARRTLDVLDAKSCRILRQLNTAYDAWQLAKSQYREVGHPKRLRRQTHYQSVEKKFWCAMDLYVDAPRYDAARVVVEEQRLTVAIKKYLSGGLVKRYYCNGMRLNVNKTGELNIYFGGKGGPNGRIHGHYVVQPGGGVSYKRRPGERRGWQNYCTPSTALNVLKS